VSYLTNRPMSPAAEVVVDQRTEARQRAWIRTLTILEDGQLEEAAKLVDLSPLGCQFLSARERAPGDVIHLQFPGMDPFEAVIMWKRGGQQGCQFLERMSQRGMLTLTLPEF
jgi:hypothetical protein